MSGIVKYICRVCSQPLIFDLELHPPIIYNDDKEHEYNLVCSNRLCGIRAIRKINSGEFMKFYKEQMSKQTKS